MSLVKDLSKKYVIAEEVLDSQAMEKVCFEAYGDLLPSLSEFRKKIADTGIFRVDKNQKIDDKIEDVAGAFSDLFGVCKEVIKSK